MREPSASSHLFHAGCTLSKRGSNRFSRRPSCGWSSLHRDRWFMERHRKKESRNIHGNLPSYSYESRKELGRLRRGSHANLDHKFLCLFCINRLTDRRSRQGTFYLISQLNGSKIVWGRWRDIWLKHRSWVRYLWRFVRQHNLCLGLPYWWIWFYIWHRVDRSQPGFTGLCLNPSLLVSVASSSTFSARNM